MIQFKGQKISAKAAEPRIDVKVDPASISTSCGTGVVREAVPPYTGPYTVTPTETAKVLNTADKRLDSDLRVNAIPSNYVGTGVPRRSSSALVAVENTVTVPRGYYASNASKSVPRGDAGTPSISRSSGTHSATFTPFCASTAGYISGGTRAGTSVTVTASELVSGSATITGNTTGYDVRNLASVNVQIPNATWASDPTVTANPSISVDSSGLITASVNASTYVSPITADGIASHNTVKTLFASGSNTKQLTTQAGTTITPTTSAQTAVPAGTFVTGDVDVAAMPNGVRGNRVDRISQTSTKKRYQIDHPDATAGYYPASTFTPGDTLELTLQSETVTPTGSAQTVTPTSAIYYLDSVEVEGVVCENLTAANIKSGVTVKVGTATDDDSVASVTGTFSNWTKLGSAEIAVNTTSTTATAAGYVYCDSSVFTKSKIIYVRVRDKAGPRAGYFYGNDTFFINFNDANGSTSAFSTGARHGLFYDSSSQWATESTTYGVYGHSVATDGTVTIRRRYNSSYGTINGTFLCEVYALDFPDGKSPFDTGAIT